MPHSSDVASSSTNGSQSFRHKYTRSSSASSVISQSRHLSPTSRKADGEAKFPRIDECAHFHYETVDCGEIKMCLLDEPPDGTRLNGSIFEYGKSHQAYWIKVACKEKEWIIRRLTEQFVTLDELLHECVYDRKFSRLPLLKHVHSNSSQDNDELLQRYLKRLSELPEDQISCAPVLHWFEIDNRGRNLVAALGESADINIPAVAAAHAIRRYTAQAADELSLEVGDMVSIIDMNDHHWWRGKCKLRVGSFPSQCVQQINDAKRAQEVVPKAGATISSNLPSSPISSSPPAASTSKTKPIVKKHGKFMDFLRSFLVTRPSKSRLKQTGILKERVFGCDLGEYLHNCGDNIPIVVKDCTAFVENHGVVDGIYRISGVSSHVQNLRHEYDCERRPNLNRDPSGRGEQSICDPHSVAGLCKLYFSGRQPMAREPNMAFLMTAYGSQTILSRYLLTNNKQVVDKELPNPLLTYQLYNRFAEAINAHEEEKLLRIHDVIQQLPPPHYRTLKHLSIHLQRMANQDEKTSMHCRNLAIVWAPNLLRSRDLEAGLAAFTEARVQSVVTEFLISNADLLFSEKLQTMQYDGSRTKPPRPKSLLVYSAPKLISLEEAQARSRAGGKKLITSSAADDVRLLDQNLPKDFYRSGRALSSPDKFTLQVPVCSSPQKNSDVQSVLGKRRQSMDPQLTGRPPHGFQSNSRQYASHHSGWRLKIGSFLRKGGDSTLGKNSHKARLRRSLSDDSLLSPHSSRQNLFRNGDGEVERKIESNNAVAIARSSRRQAQSPRRSPRPKGGIFKAIADDTSLPSVGRKAGNIDLATTPDDGSHCVPGTPESILTPSNGTSTHSPFSGLDSDFPGVMTEDGLDFDPLQFSPSKSPENSLTDSRCIAPESYEQQSLEVTVIDTDMTIEGCRPNREALTKNRKERDRCCNSERKSAEGVVLYPPDCDKSSGDARTREKSGIPVLESFDELCISVNCQADKFRAGSTESQIQALNSSSQQNNSNNRYHICKDSCRLNTRDHVDNRKWIKHENVRLHNRKTSYTDGSIDNGINGHLQNNNHHSHPGVHKVKVAKRNSIKASIDMPVTDNCAVHYIKNCHSNNGKTRQSITATFVQDRTRDRQSSQPHSIVRSMDVPPPVAVHTPNSNNNNVPYGVKTCSSLSIRPNRYPITKRQQAFHAVIALQKDSNVKDKNSSRLHSRSMSGGDLDFKHIIIPVPLPRKLSNVSSHKPVPLPRRRLQGRSDELHNWNKASLYQTVSAPSTPVDSLRCFPTSSIVEESIKENQSSNIIHKANIQSRKLPSMSEEFESSSIMSDEDCSVTSKHRSGKSSADNISASTVLSWV